jgi:RNA polymerase sigma-70 factor (ECF subfamily)
VLSGGASGARVALVEGLAGLVWAPGGRTRGVVAFTLDGGRIVEIDVIGDPEHLGQLDVVLLDH